MSSDKGGQSVDFFDSRTIEIMIKQLEAADIPSLMIDIDGAVRYTNPAAERKAPGAEKRDWLSGMVSADQLAQGLAKIASGESFSFAASPLGGDTVVFRGSPLFDGDTPAGALVTFSDGVSDPASLTELLGSAGSIVLEGSFRHLLSDIFANLSVINRSVYASSDSSLSDYLDNLNTLSYRLLRNTGNMVAAMRFCTDSKPEQNPTAFWAALAELLSAAAMVMRPTGVLLEYELPKDEAYVLCSFPSIAGALLNIIANAARATGRSGVVRLTGSRLSGSVLVTVADEGCGISAEKLGKIFTPYYSAFEDGGDEGLGLGLSVARQVIDTHGGTITVRSEVGEGSTFAVTLPTIQEPAEGKLSLTSGAADYLRDRFSVIYVGLCELATPPEQ